MNNPIIKNGDLLRIKSALDGALLIALVTTAESSDATTTQQIIMVDEADNFRASYELPVESVVEVLGSASQFFAAHPAEYRRMLDATDGPIDTLSMVRAVDLLHSSGSATDVKSVAVAIEQAKAIGENRVTIFEHKLQALAA